MGFCRYERQKLFDIRITTLNNVKKVCLFKKELYENSYDHLC